MVYLPRVQSILRLEMSLDLFKSILNYYLCIHPTQLSSVLSPKVWYPLLRFKEEGMETFTIAPEAGKTYTSKKGYPCKSDRDIVNVTSQVILLLAGSTINANHKRLTL